MIIDLTRVFSRDASVLPAEAADNLLPLLLHYLTLGVIGGIMHFVPPEVGAGRIVVTQIFRHSLMHMYVL